MLRKAVYETEEPIEVPKFEEANGFYTTKARSQLMSKIRGKNTKPELMLRKALWQEGIRYRLHNKSLPGNPDLANLTWRFVIFIDGEFWHGYNWEQKKHDIKTNRGFWLPKIERNMQRDRRNNLLLEEQGFKVFRFWDREVTKQLDACVEHVQEYIERQKEGREAPFGR